MIKNGLSRRTLLKSAAVISAASLLGIKPEQVLSAEGGLLKVRMEADIQVLDPGYMIGGTETSIQYACLPRLAVPVKKGDAWDCGMGTREGTKNNGTTVGVMRIIDFDMSMT